MQRRNKNWAAIGVLIALVLFPTTATAQAKFAGVPLNEAFRLALWDRGGDYFASRNFYNQADLIFGIGLFPENRVRKDAKAISNLFVDAMAQQTQSTPPVRTRDLPNPYNSSLRLMLNELGGDRVGDRIFYQP